MGFQFSGCTRRKFTPWLVGLLILVLASLVYFAFTFNKGRNVGSLFDGLGMDLAAKNSPAAPLPNLPPGKFAGSYHQIVDLIRPAVVGISAAGARPFLQAMPPGQPQAWGPGVGPGWQCPIGQAQAWGGPGPGGGPCWQCPNCRVLTSGQMGPGICPRCPNCGNWMQATQPPVPGLQSPQPQVWQPSASQVALQGGVNLIKEEYLQCPNCGVRINQTPGIPWAGAVCPSCKTVMAHVIREKETLAASIGAVNPVQQVLNPFNVSLLPEGTPIPPRSPWNLFPPLGHDPNENPFGLQLQALQQPNQQIGQQIEGGAGAGVIVSKRGYILTSYHLVADQPNLTVTLFTPQGPKTFPATVETTLPASNLAVVKIVPAGIDLPVAPLGNSDSLNIGDPVLAFGNPFGLSQTVTSGIVSAIRQSVTIQGQSYQNLIQTDAPINQGNAGGPLVNMRGEIIGINAAIYSPMQTNTGLGFAIPVNQAQQSLAAFIDASPSIRPVAMQWAAGAAAVPGALPVPQVPATSGPQRPVWVGVEFQPLNKAMADQLKAPFNSGIVINNVYPNSPAALAGLERGDVLYRLNGRRIIQQTDLQGILEGKQAGDVVRFDFFRNGRKQSVNVELAPGSAQQAAAANIPKPTTLLAGSEIEAGTADIVSLGLTVDKITPEVAFAFGLPEGTTGVVISGVEGLAMARGVQSGDVVSSVDGRPTPDLLSFFKAIKRGNLSKGVTMGLKRRGDLVQIVITEPVTSQIQGV
ncbi:MAG: trypsin-like peptidase domain-containing protein [Elusimicrobia bacterium]|nr:trypsin-like peptidase domain-containing protein [Candidatus Obscuribacterium magneticum]